MNLYSEFWVALKELLAENDGGTSASVFSNERVTADVPDLTSRQELFEILSRCITVQGDKTLALKLGQSLQVMSLGLLGLAVANCQTVTQVSRLLVRHSPLRSSGARLRLVDRGDTLKLSFFERIPPIPKYPFLAHELFFSSVISATRQLAMAPLDGIYLELVGTGHSSAETYADLIGVPVKKNCDINQLVMPKALTEAPLMPTGSYRPRELHMRLYEGLLKKSAPEAGFSGTVRSIFLRCIGQPVDASIVAAQLNMSERTLRRRLDDEKTSLREIRDNLFKQIACRYLESTNLSVAEIGEMLGYNEYANFRRTFLRWTGKSPASYRQSKQHPQLPKP